MKGKVLASMRDILYKRTLRQVATDLVITAASYSRVYPFMP